MYCTVIWEYSFSTASGVSLTRKEDQIHDRQFYCGRPATNEAPSGTYRVNLPVECTMRKTGIIAFPALQRKSEFETVQQ